MCLRLACVIADFRKFKNSIGTDTEAIKFKHFPKVQPPVRDPLPTF